MQVTDIEKFSPILEKIDIEKPGVILVSGSDRALFDTVLKRIKNHLIEAVGSFETIVLSGEPGDENRLHEEIFNIPLFISYRLIVVRQGEEVFKSILSNSQTLKIWKKAGERIPDRTMLAIQYSGQAPKKLTTLFETRIIHLITRDLFQNQIDENIHRQIKKRGLKLDNEAVFEFRNKIAPRSGDIEEALDKLVQLLPDKGDENVTVNEIRELLFPALGLNPFVMIDSLFFGDYNAFAREMDRFNAATDNLFVVLKLALQRIGEIRKTRIGRKAGLNDAEIIRLLEIESRPPFVKKKILHRLSGEIKKYNGKKISEIYRCLISLQKDFRSIVPVAKQPFIFIAKAGEVFFT